MSTSSKRFFESTKNIKSCDYFDSSEGLSLSVFPQELFLIVSLFAEDCNYNLINLYTDYGKRLFVSGYRLGRNTARNELLLRMGNKKLVVARVEFIHQREGKMTELYRILKNIRKKYHLKPIIIESCVTEASINWCLKNGFVPMDDGSFTEKE